jgi:iron complex outermembrane receptor protein
LFQQPSPDNQLARSSWWSNTGVFTQGQLALSEQFVLTSGLRLEQMSGPAEAGRFALLPMSGASWVNELGPVAVKLRAAYGRGIRPARTVAGGATWSGGRARETLAGLDPEEQAGTEGGIDVLWGSVLGVHATRFDQRASGLVQPVAFLGLTQGGGARGPGSPEVARVLYQLQNVGAIDNSGWELQATSSHGPLAVSATMTFVSSRVARLASGYRGDLREGDRMLEVPARTFGLQAQWSGSRWSLTGSVANAMDWVNYDQVALASTVATDPTGRLTPVGAALRSYWRTYQSATQVGSGASFLLGERASIMLTGANLLNQQTGQPDNATVVPGRTLKLGMRNTF